MTSSTSVSFRRPVTTEPLLNVSCTTTPPSLQTSSMYFNLVHDPPTLGAQLSAPRGIGAR